MNQQCPSLRLVHQIGDLISNKFAHLSEDEIQTKCNEIVQSYQSLTDKIVFEDKYAHDFLIRIAMKRDEYLKYEEMIILKIREIKPTFLQIFDDVKTSINGLNQKIQYYLHNHSKKETLNADFEPIVSQEYKIHPPHYYANESPLTNACTSFMTLINEGNNSLKSNIINDLSNCDLELEFPNGKKYIITSDFNVSSIILAISQSHQKFDDICKFCKDIKYASKIIKTLHEIKLIKRIGTNVKLAKNDIFEINQNFSSEKEHIIIPPVIYSRQKCIDVEQIERLQAIKFAILRLLKQNKHLERTEIENRIKEKFKSYFESTNEMIDKELKSIENINAQKNTLNGKEIWEYIA